MSQKLVERLQQEFGTGILAAGSNHGDETVTVAAERLRDVLRHLRDKEGCEQLSDLVGVDFPQREQRFELVYLLRSWQKNQRLQVKVGVAEDEAVPTVSDIYRSADWAEREVYDLYGVPFSRPSGPAPHPLPPRVRGPRPAQGLPHRAGAGVQPAREALHRRGHRPGRATGHRPGQRPGGRGGRGASLGPADGEHRAQPPGHPRGAARRAAARRRDDPGGAHRDRLHPPLLREGGRGPHLGPGDAVHRPPELLLGHAQQLDLRHGGGEAAGRSRSRRAPRRSG